MGLSIQPCCFWSPASIDHLFRAARQQANLPKALVLYCARHDYGTRVLMCTGNLAAVMKTMGHRDVKTALHYQHPELDVVRAALDYGAASETTEMRVAKPGYGTFYITPEKPQPREVIDNSGNCASEENPSRINGRKSWWGCSRARCARLRLPSRRTENSTVELP